MIRPFKLDRLNELARQLNRMQNELMQAQEANAPADQSSSPSTVDSTQVPNLTLVDMLSQLSAVLEDLQVAEEEIHQQSDELKTAFEAVDRERMHYQELFDFAPEAYLLTDINGTIREANHATSNLLNVPAHSLLGKPLAVFISAEFKQSFYRLMVTARDTDTRKVDELLLKPRHNSPITAEFTVLTTRDANGMPAAQRWLIRDVSYRKQIEEELAHSRGQLQTFATNLQTAREEERARVAREIHDELGQTLTSLRLDVGIAKKQVPAEMNELHKKLEQISLTIVDAIQSVRRIMTDLRPSVLDEAGLIAALEWQCSDFRSRSGIHCRFLTKEKMLDLDEESTNAIFRLTQEMLTNAAKHSGASRVSIELKQDKQWVQLEVRDNGRGITESEINNSFTAGMLGMRERVRLLNGQIDFQGVPKRGTRIRVRLLRQSQQPAAKPQTEG